MVRTTDSLQKKVELGAAEEGIKTILIKAHNKISGPIEVSTEVVIEIPVSGLTFSSPKPRQSLEVNETFKICSNAALGSNPK